MPRAIPLTRLQLNLGVSLRSPSHIIASSVSASVSRALPAVPPPGRLVTRARTGAVLVTGATGRVGRLVVDELLRAGVAVRALTRRPEQAALPAGAEVVAGDFTVPT